MKISILLPYKENFSPTYAGAVSIFINDTVKISKFKKNIIIYGNTNNKIKFNNNTIYKKFTEEDLVKLEIIDILEKD